MKFRVTALALAGMVALSACSAPTKTTSTASGEASTTAPAPKSNPTPTAFTQPQQLTSIAAQADEAGVVPRVRMTLADTKLYAISEGTAELHAVDLNNKGRELWSYTLPETKTAPLVAQVELQGPGAPLVSADKKVVYAAAFTADPQNSKNLYEGAAESPQRLSIVAVDAASGKPIWSKIVKTPHWDPVNSQTTPEKAYTLPVDLTISNGVIMANARYITLGFDASTGNELWRLDRNQTLRTDEAGHVFSVTTGAQGGTLSAFDAKTGKPGATLLSGVVKADVLQAAGEAALVKVTTYGKPHALLMSATSSAAKELGTLENDPTCSPLPGATTVVCAGPDNTTWFIDPATAKPLVSITPAMAPKSVTAFGGQLYGSKGTTGVVYGADGKPIGANLTFGPVLVNQYGAVSVNGRKVFWQSVT